GVEFLLNAIPDRAKDSIDVQVLTDLSPDNILASATDPRALARIQESIRTCRVWHLRRLHAKAYIADDRRAIVTSGNLTAGGLWANYEYGVCINDSKLASEIARDVIGYAALG